MGEVRSPRHRRVERGDGLIEGIELKTNISQGLIGGAAFRVQSEAGGERFLGFLPSLKVAGGSAQFEEGFRLLLVKFRASLEALECVFNFFKLDLNLPKLEMKAGISRKKTDAHFVCRTRFPELTGRCVDPGDGDVAFDIFRVEL